MLLTVILVLCSVNISFAAITSDIESAVDDMAACIVKTVPCAQVGSISGEWAILGLARSDCKVNGSYYQTYYSNVEAYVKACNGVLSDKKYTEYSRVILALTAIGKDPSNVAGYNLLTPLGDYDKTIWQGINGPIFALIALDSGNYDMPMNSSAATQATRNMYVKKILSLQLDNGGFSLNGISTDPDITAMALQALSKYQDNTNVAVAISKALTRLSLMQNSMGGFTCYEASNAESVSQAIVALGELDISLEDNRFVKNGHSLVDNLFTYYVKGSGFKHTEDNSGANQLSTEQAFYALVSAQREIKGENSLYNMSDAILVADSSATDNKSGEGLTGKNADVKVQAITTPDKTFIDISGANASKYKIAIETLASRGIIGGYEDGTFRSQNTMTRAEFATIIVKALGLTPKNTTVFKDVAAPSWYAPFVGTAYTYGIVYGKSTSTFDPSGIITRQEAAVMVARAAKLCGLNIAMTTYETRDALAQFDDYVKVAVWAQNSMAFCYSNNILEQSDFEIQPAKAITRGEISQMLFNMLNKANLL